MTINEMSSKIEVDIKEIIAQVVGSFEFDFDPHDCYYGMTEKQWESLHNKRCLLTPIGTAEEDHP